MPPPLMAERIRYIREPEPGVGISWEEDDSDASSAATPARIASTTGQGNPLSSALSATNRKRPAGRSCAIQSKDMPPR